MVIKMLIELRRRMDEHSEDFNKDKKIFLKYQTEATELNNTLEAFNRRLDKAE